MKKKGKKKEKGLNYTGLQKLLNDPKAMEEFAKSIKLDLEIKYNQKERIKKYFDSLSIEQINEWIPKIIKWEEEYEEFQYNERHCHSTSKLFHHILEIIEDLSVKIEDLDENFLALAFEWNGYLFRLYVGQGSFWRITKGDEFIFQSK